MKTRSWVDAGYGKLGNWGIGGGDVCENPEKIISMATSVDEVLQLGL